MDQHTKLKHRCVCNIYNICSFVILGFDSFLTTFFFLQIAQDDLQGDIEEKNQRLKDMEITISQSSQMGKSDHQMRVEIDNLRHELQVSFWIPFFFLYDHIYLMIFVFPSFENNRSRSETKRHETELLIDNQNTMINELTKKVFFFFNLEFF